MPFEQPLPSSLSSASSNRTLDMTRPWIIWGCATLFYLFQFVLRVSPSVMVSDLMTTFQIDAATAGSIGASYYLAYSLAQIPVGLLLDQWGARRTLLLMILLCVLGCWGFAHAPDVTWAKVSRLLIGVGSAGGFLGCAKIAHTWFPPRRAPFIIGLTITIGTLGAIYGGQPLAQLIQELGWRATMESLVLAGCVLSTGIIFLVQDPPLEKSMSSPNLMRAIQSLGTRLRIVLSCVASRRAACAGIGGYLILSVFADMWGVTYIQQTFGLTKSAAAEMTSTIYGGLLIGSPLLPWLSSVWHSRTKPLWCALMLALTGWMILFFMPHALSLGALQLLLLIMGITSGAQVIPFAVAADMIPKSHIAVATAFVNMTIMLMGAVLQYQAGWVLDVFWEGSLSSEGMRLYPSQAFQWALGCMVVWIMFSLVMLWRLPDTYPSKTLSQEKQKPTR